MAEGKEHHRLKIVAMAYLKSKCKDLVATEVKFYNARSRADACGINLKRKEIRIVEVKTSRQDFLRDKKLRDIKISCFNHCHYFYIFCPWDIIKTNDIPNEYGLAYVDEQGNIKIIKSPKRNKNTLRTRFETILKNTCRAATNDLLFNYYDITSATPSLKMKVIK